MFLLRYQVKQKAFSDFHILISENAKKNCHIRFLQYSSFLIFLFTSYVKIPVPHSQLNGSVRRSFHSYHCSLFRFFLSFTMLLIARPAIATTIAPTTTVPIQNSFQVTCRSAVAVHFTVTVMSATLFVNGNDTWFLLILLVYSNIH